MMEINKIIESTVEHTIVQLKRQGLVKDNKQTPFQKTEQLLYNYNNFQSAVKDKYEQIENLRQLGLPQKSKSITSVSSNMGMINTDNEYEKIENRIEMLKSTILVTSQFIAIIDSALDKISDDPYYDLIRLKYFEEKSREDIADEMGVDVSTITRNKNRLIDILKITLFSDEVIFELFTQ